MSLNVRYRRGRAFEYAIKRMFKKPRYETARTAGSHGFYDVSVVDQEDLWVTFIQARKVNAITPALREYWTRLSKTVKLPISCSFEFWLKVKGQTKIVVWKQDEKFNGQGLS